MNIFQAAQSLRYRCEDSAGKEISFKPHSLSPNAMKTVWGRKSHSGERNHMLLKRTGSHSHWFFAPRLVTANEMSGTERFESYVLFV